MARKQVYKITYPNGKIYVGMDLTGAISYFGSPSAKERIAADLAEHRLDLTARKEILWESETATDAEVRAMEVKLIREQFERIKLLVETREGVTLDIKFGTMIETVRACLDADEIAKYAEFFSFGTNDLSQATFSFSREDAEAKFLPFYLDKGILPDNPFETIDEKGVGKLIRMAVEAGRRTRPDLEVGICGEHGGDPRSIYLCHGAALNYVSASSFRIPVARLAAARIALQDRAAE